eukprot:8109116-Karenia_brevis.AAC.1
MQICFSTSAALSICRRSNQQQTLCHIVLLKVTDTFLHTMRQLLRRYAREHHWHHMALTDAASRIMLQQLQKKT